MHNPIPTTPSPAPAAPRRPHAAGKFIFAGGRKLYVRGVTYGPFRPQPDGGEYGDLNRVNEDFSRMTSAGINAIRTYTVPPRWLLDRAQDFGLWVLVGLPWEQQGAFLNDTRLARQIEGIVREGVRACAGHPVLLGYAIGNEIPAGIVRWHGPRKIERYIRKLYDIAKAEDPGALAAYVNYPSTEYLELPFIDLFCFNLYLESPLKFDAYLARLQNLAGDRPLVLAEIGLDSRSNGEAGQAVSLDWQIRLAFQNGCAGVFTFAWTDEWHRSGRDVLDWDFGLTRRDRAEKPALAAVQNIYTEVPFPRMAGRPRISVIVCTYDGTATLAECLAGLQSLVYPDFEVVVVNDGSSPGVTAIAGWFNVRLINLPHSGLSAARNCGLAAATGGIVAYLDDDSWPDPHWLQYLAHTFTTTEYAAVGGPNVPPPPKSIVAGCVAQAPGGPVHVLLSDRDAEHIPGCNMAFRKTVLESIGGFDPQFRTAGDDVDLCWRLTDCGYTIGFNPGAMVWHHRRQNISAYWKQQSGYGQAEALLERKWPAKYNAAGQPAWHGRIYGAGWVTFLGWRHSRIYHGTWGSALFQSLYSPVPSSLWSLARMPEWYLLIFMLAALTALSLAWWPLLWALPLLLLAVGIPMAQALGSAWRVPVNSTPERLLVAWLHLLQPLARLHGRIKFGLTPWRPRRLRGFAWPGLRTCKIWSERWRSPFEWLAAVETPLQEAGASVFRGGDYDRWDLEVRGGILGSVRLQILIEEHGTGKQLVCVRAWPCTHLGVWLFALINAAIAAGASLDEAWMVAAIFSGITFFCLLGIFAEWAGAMSALLGTLRTVKSRSEAVTPASAGEPAPKPASAPNPIVPAP